MTLLQSVNPNEPSDALKQPTFFFQILIPFASAPFSLAQFVFNK